MKSWISKHKNKIKLLIATLGLILVGVDVFVAVTKNSITYSQLFRNNESKLIWLVFAAGGMMVKIYYQKSTQNRAQATRYFLMYIALVLILFFVGRSFTFELSNPLALLTFFSGAVAAYFLWQQYDAAV